MSANGVDVSHYQDPDEVSLAGVAFVIAKASESTGYVDKTLATWRAKANAAGVLFGTYHFARPTPRNMAAEADHYIKTANPRPGELVALDIETTEHLNGTALDSWCRLWVGRVRQSTGRTPLIYTNRSVGEHLDGCAHLPLWIADPDSPPGKPRLPANWRSWAIHQHSITHGVDRNVARDLTTLRALASPTKGEPDVALTDAEVERIREAVWSTRPDKPAADGTRWPALAYLVRIEVLARTIASTSNTAALVAALKKAGVGVNVTEAQLAAALVTALKELATEGDSA